MLDECHRWKVHLVWREFESLWRRDGFVSWPDYLAFWGKPEKLERILEKMPASVPVVSAIGGTMELPVFTVMPNPRSITKVVAKHLLAQGLRHFVYIGPLENPAGRIRGELFEESLRRCDQDIHYQDFTCLFEERFWGGNTRQGRSLIRMLSKCKCPVGLFAFNDQTAVSCMECIAEVGLSVPQEVAVVGVDNHPLYTKMFSPLTSVAIDFQEIGRRAARILFERPDEARNRKVFHFFVEGSLVVRDSSRFRLAADPVVSGAVDYLREHFAEPIALADLARKCGVSRSALSARFNEALGEAPIQHLIRMRIEHARNLLTEGRLTVSEVAHHVGFEDQAYFTRAFKKHTGTTPSAFRGKEASATKK